MEINVMAFVENLRYMGLGMLGIFVVMGLIIVSTVLLNIATAHRKNNDEK